MADGALGAVEETGLLLFYVSQEARHATDVMGDRMGCLEDGHNEDARSYLESAKAYFPITSCQSHPIEMPRGDQSHRATDLCSLFSLPACECLCQQGNGPTCWAAARRRQRWRKASRRPAMPLLGMSSASTLRMSGVVASPCSPEPPSQPPHISLTFQYFSNVASSVPWIGVPLDFLPSGLSCRQLGVRRAEARLAAFLCVRTGSA